jgi:hypothetical protein
MLDHDPLDLMEAYLIAPAIVELHRSRRLSGDGSSPG